MKNVLPFFFYLLCQSTFSFSQSNEEWISTRTVQARFSTESGALINDFTIPSSAGPSIGFRDILLWTGGVTPPGNLAISRQQNDLSESNFAFGFRGVPNSDKIWKVTKQEMKQHKADLADNGKIDNPLPAIYSWPAFGNPYSEAYNGFSMESISYTLAAPDAQYLNRPYKPDLGHYPSFGSPVHFIERIPDEIVFFPFYENEENGLDFNAIFYTYYCDEAPFLDHTIFGYITFQKTGYPPLDSFHLAFEITAPGDLGGRFMGTTQNHELYFYAADTLQQDNHLLVFETQYGILDTTNYYGDYTIMPLYQPTLNPPLPSGMLYPYQDNEYYNLLTGTWRDGTPLTPLNRGYTPELPLQTFVQQAFDGNPGIPGDWAEIHANMPIGDRTVLFSNGPVYIKEGWKNSILFSLSYIPPDTSLQTQLNSVRSYSNDKSGFGFAHYYPSPNPYDLRCVETMELLKDPSPVPMQVVPNPATDQISLHLVDEYIVEFFLYDPMGRLIDHQNELEFYNVYDVSKLKSGIYFIHCKLYSGRTAVARVIIY
ncbi:MAG: T9SS type A sorting domain-containing protein [Saprospiraceae bacterium]